MWGLELGGGVRGKLTAADRSSAGFDEVDVVLLLQGLDLGRGEASVGEHAIL